MVPARPFFIGSPGCVRSGAFVNLCVRQKTRDGIGPLVGIVSVLLVTVALVALVNMALAELPGGVTLQRLFAILFRPVMWLIGVPWTESGPAAALMGTKTVLNEFVAYLDLAKLPGTLGPRARLIVTYALCGFANFGSMGILVGGLGAMVPERRREITALGCVRSCPAPIATCMSGAVAGLLAPTP
jgi:concentrative nucleoside transporter, CNT family